MRILKYAVIILFAFLIWAGIIIFGTLQGYWKNPITKKQSSEAFIQAVNEVDNIPFIGNMAIALIKDGNVSKEFFYSYGEPINRNTIFQMASISKWVTAWGVLSLMEDGKLDLDTPISTYLTRWQLPESEFDNKEVTIRRILSHTAGLTVHGYGGFPPDEPIQTLEGSLTKAKDCDGGVATKVDIKPGSKFKYSGGGFTILQLIIEEVSGQSFEQYMKQAVFKPLQMNNSTFHWTDTAEFELATFYDKDSSIAPHYKYTAIAAASFYTNLADFELFLKAHLSSNNGVLNNETITMMSQPNAKIFGLDFYGLGTMVLGKNIIGHNGNNRPAINTAARVNLTNGDGIIILQTGSNWFASEMVSEWQFWNTGQVDIFSLKKSIVLCVKLVVIGWLVISFLAFFLIRRSVKKGRRKGNTK